MPRFRDLSLRLKFTLVVMLVAGVALALDSAAVLASMWFGSRETTARDLATRANIVGSNCTAAITFDDRAAAAEALNRFADDEYMLAACVYGKNGSPFATYRANGATVVIPPQAGEPLHRFEGGQLTVLRPITLNRDIIGSIWLAWDWGLYRSRFLDFTGIVFSVMLLSLGIALFLSTKLQRLFTEPILDLVGTARRVALSRDYTERARKYAQDELGVLTDAFNEMLTEIQERDVALRRAYDELEERVRVRTHELNEAKERAESSDHAKSEFLANMSHEIRTPMTAILGFAELLAEPTLTESQRLNAVSTIQRNGEHLLSIMNDILDLSKIEAGRMNVERILCSPVRLIAEVLSLMRVRAEAKNLSLDVEYFDPLPETIQSDPMRLRQILLNLLGNAIKFTDVQGVRLIVRLVTGETPMIQFDVQDTGIGMSDAEVATLFRPFTQADTSTSRRFGGTGLGLAISKRLAELLGGSIGVVDSRLGIGTRVRLSVPTGPLHGVRMIENTRSETLSTPDESTHPQASSCGFAYHILLAEDALDNQRLLTQLLGSAGATVTVVDNGKIAVDRALAAEADGSPFDVILMDMQMPVMSGYEATTLLRTRGYRGPVIAITAHAMAGDWERCLRAGCDDFATKPVDRYKLIEIIRRNISRMASINERIHEAREKRT